MDERYQSGKIYYLECLETGEIYVGSTIRSKEDRLIEHKSQAKHTQNKSTSAKQIIDRGNYRMVIVEYYPCCSKQELESREEVHRRLQQKAVNRQRVCLTEEERKKYKAEWFQKTYIRAPPRVLLTEEEKQKRRRDYREANKERDQAYRDSRKEIQAELTKKHYEENKELYKERAKKRYEDNKEEIAEQKKRKYEENKEAEREKRRVYYQQNKEKIKAKEKENREQNRDKLNARRRELDAQKRVAKNVCSTSIE